MVLKCHYCDGTLESGEARIHGTITGFLLFGFSHQNLYFKTESGEESEVLGSGMSTPAMKCDKCGVFILNKNLPNQNRREIITELLTLCSFKELRDNIEDSGSIITAKWKENYLPENNDFKNYFSINELSLLADFDILINEGNWDKIEMQSEKINKKLDNK